MANGTKAASDDREQVMWDNYINQMRKNPGGRPSALKAAKEAGYSKDQSRNITMQQWFKDRVARMRRKDMLSTAEQNLQDMLTMDTYDKEVVPQLATIKKDVSVTVAKTLGKNYYSERKEMTGADGKDLFETKDKKSITDKLKDIL